ncbi:hypothetical protein [Nevskia sp.]|uniref:hypothetical protein n=1 Tax=Nevskia sp. TaxID=1929292 RepID=UPI0025DA4F0A|nr:hypothetical protein [Nevskia sp.]
MATTINGVNFSQVGKDALTAAKVLLDDPATWKGLKDILQNVADGLTADIKFIARKKLSGEFNEDDARVYLEDQKTIARVRIRSVAIITLQIAERVLNAVLDVFRVAVQQAIGWTVL